MNNDSCQDGAEGLDNVLPFPQRQVPLHLVKARVDHPGRGQLIELSAKPRGSQLPAVRGSTQPLVREGPKEIRGALQHFPKFTKEIVTPLLGENAVAMVRLVQSALFDPAMLNIDGDIEPHSIVHDMHEKLAMAFYAALEASDRRIAPIVSETMTIWDREDKHRRLGTPGVVTVDRYQFVIDLQALLRNKASLAGIDSGSKSYRAISSVVPLFCMLCVCPTPTALDACWYTFMTRYYDRFPEHTWGRSPSVG